MMVFQRTDPSILPCCAKQLLIAGYVVFLKDFASFEQLWTSNINLKTE